MPKYASSIRKILRSKYLYIGLFILLLLIPILLYFKKESEIAIPTMKNSKDSAFLYEVANHNFKAKLGTKSDNTPKVEIERDGKSVSFALTNIHKPNVVREYNGVTFQQVDNNINLKYTPLINGIKEEIILNKKGERSSFTFDLNLKDLKFKKQVDGSFDLILVDAEGKYQFHFEEPYAYDAKGQKTYAISLTIKEKDGKYTLFLEADKKWLNDKNRTYPVYIDPTIVHDTSSEFAAGSLNRVYDTGSGSSPVLQTYYQELALDSYTAGLWHLNEGSGNAVDSSVNANTLTATGTSVVTGLLNNARSFNGSTDYFSCTDANCGGTGKLDIGTRNFTVEAWIQTTASARQIVVGKGSSSANFSYSLETGLSSDGKPDFLLYNDVNGAYMNADGTIAVNDNLWHHLAGVYDGTYIYLYIDGKLNATGSVKTGVFVPDSASDFEIGARGGSTLKFNGQIDEVRVSGILRTPEEIKLSAQRRPYSVYTSDVLDTTSGVTGWNPLTWTELGVTTGDGETPYSTTSLRSQWNLNSTSGTTATSDSGSCGSTCNLTLTLFDSTASQDADPDSSWTLNSTRWGAGALQFDGVDSYAGCTEVNCGGTTKLDFNASQDFSYETWFRTNLRGTSKVLLSKRDGSAAINAGYTLFLDTSNQLNCRIGDGTTTALKQSQGSYPYADGNWHYVVCVVNRSNQTLTLYVDGVADPGGTVSTSAVSNTLDNAQDFRLGALGGTPVTFFNGTLDSPRVYGRVLTASEILSNYQSSNIELQTRVGADTSPDDGSWEAWKPTTSEVQAFTFDGDALGGNWTHDPLARPSGDMIVFSSVNVAAVNAYSYNRTFNNSTVVATGDTFEYDVMTNLSISGIGGVDVRYTDTTYARSSGWVDQNGASCLGETYDYSLYRWMHRVCTFLAADNGKTISWIDLVNENDTAASVVAYYDNVVIKNSSGVVKSVIYTAGAAPVNTTDIESNATNTGTSVLAASNNAYVPITYDESNIKVQGTGSIKFSNKPVIDLNTVALWHLDETGGTGAYLKNSAPGAYHGTPTGTTIVNGISDKARSFNGSSDYITITSEAAAFSVNSYTYSAWINESTDNASDRNFIDNRDALDDGTRMLLTTGDLLRCSYNATSTTGTTVFVPNQWYHVACTSDGATLRVYVNGVQENSTAIAGSIAETTDAKIGNRSFGVNNGLFPGTMDDVQVNNRAKSAEEIFEEFRMRSGTAIHRGYSASDVSSFKTLPIYIAADRPGTYLQSIIGDTRYGNWQTDPNTIGYWNFEEANGSGAYIKDSSWGNRHGTPTGTTSVAGKIGKARNFTGADDISMGSQTLVDSSANVTVDAWIYPTTQTAATHYRVFSEDAVLYVGQIGAQISFYMGNGTSWLIQENSGGLLPINQWSYVTWVKSGTNYFVYLNGQLIKSGTGAPATIGTSSNINYISTYDGTNQPWSGAIDQVRISNTARSADEIRQAFESSNRTHLITIDFAAKLSTDDLITNSGDTSFEVDATYYGLRQQADKLYKEDKIIIKENYDGTEYLAQGTVTGVTASTGAVTVAAWDSGSTFPSGGYGQNASVFKWQREYWDISKPLNSQVDGTTSFSIKMLDGSEGRTVYFDDLRGAGSYLTTPTGSTVTSSSGGNRYIQYRAIETSSDIGVSSQLTQVTLDYVSNYAPATPTLITPTANATGQVQPLAFTFSSTDSESDYIRYKIEICENLEMTFNCITADQTSSQTGWSGQNAETSTAYTSGSTATYTTSALKNAHTYFWRTYATDPGGTNTWSGTQTPRQFITNAPTRPSVTSALTIYSATRNAEFPTTTVYWSNITGTTDGVTTASSNGWIDSTNLIAGRKYLLILTGSHNTDNVSGKSGLRLLHGSTTFESSENVDETINTNASFKKPSFWFTVWTAVDGEDLEVQQYWNGTGAQARVEDVTLMAIDAENLIANGYLQYTENKTYTALTTSLADMATLTFTPAVSGNTWWVMGYNHTSQNSSANKFENDLIINATTYGQNILTTPLNEVSPVVPLGTALTLTNSSQSIKIQAKQVGSGAIVQATGIFALNLSTFENYIAMNKSTGTAMTSIGSWTNQSSLVPLNSFNTSDWIIAAGMNTEQGGTTENVITRIQEGGVSITDDMGPGSAAIADRSPRLLLDYYQNLSAGTKTFTFDGQITGGISAVARYPWMVAFSRELVPNYTNQNLPTDGNASVPSRPTFRLTDIDPDGDYLRYKIVICTDVAMTTGCQTHDQTVSQSGWSGQNAGSGSAYTSGTQTTFVQTSDLTAGQTYYWNAYSKDPLGTNTWTSQNPTPWSFTVSLAPTAPTDLWTEGGPTPTAVTDLTPEFSAIFNDPEGDNSGSYQIQVNTASDLSGTTMWDSGKHSITTANGARSSDVSYAGTALGLTGTQYYWRIRFWDSNDTVGAWSSVSDFIMKGIEMATSCYLVKSQDSSALTLKWKDNTSLEDGYKLQRKVDGGSWVDLTTKAANAITHTDSTISYGHTYQYRVAPTASGITGTYCTTDIASVMQGSIRFEGLKMEGIQIF